MSSGLSTTCLSAASILRCPSLTRFQYVILLIPSALEAICTTSLAVMVWKAGQRRHLLLTSEGWAHLILGVIDLLSHVLTPARNDLTVFSAFDVGLGVASFLPLFFYTFYLYIYSNSDLLSSAYSLPKLLARIASLLLLFSIPAIIVANELGSHVGVRRIMFNNQILIGFPSRGLFSLNAFFTSLTLALLILFQAIVFLIAFFRLIVAVLNQRKFQNKGRDAYHLVKGVAWLSAGLKLGAIETLVGFMGGSFEAVLARKIVHCISRVLLCVGIIKGVDHIEDFNVVRKEMQEATTRSKLTLSPFNIETASPPKATGIRGKISGPRMSTFQQLSPTAKEFYQLPRAHLYQDSAFDWNKDTKSPNSAGEYSSERGLGGIHVSQVDTSGKEVVPRLRSLQELKGIEAFSNLKEQVRAQREASAETSLGEEYEYDDEKADRVTIGRRDSNGAPTLLLKRFSSAMFPSPTDVIATIRKSLFRNSARASPTESESEKGGVRESQYPATVLADYEKEYGDSYTIPTLAKDSRRLSKASSFGEKEDPVSFLRPNVSQIPAKPSPFPVQSVRGPGPYHYIRNSVIRGSQGSYASRLSDLEIVSAPRRTLSGKRADATFYSVANTQFDSSTRRSSFAGDSDIAPPPQAMFANQLAESPEDYGPLSSAPQQPVSAPASAQFRIVSDYSQFRDSTATSDYRGSTTSQIFQPQEMRNLTRQFPGPPLTFNGRPVMGGLEQRNIYDDETSSSGPETPVTAIAVTRPVRRQSGLRNEVLVGVKGKNRSSIQSDMSEQSGLTITSGFVGVVPPLPSAGPRSAPAARRSSIGPVYALPYDQDPKRVSDSSSQYSFDVDLESGNRASYMRDEVPRIAVVGDVEEGQHSPATDGHGGFTPKGGNALGLLRPKLSTNTLGGSVRPQPSMSSVASAASQDPFRDNQESPTSTTFAVDPHTPTGQMPSSATGSSFASSRSVRTIGTLTAPSHNVSAPVSPADDDMGRGNPFTISPMSLIDDLPTAAIVDSVNHTQYGRSRRPAEGWPAFASPDSARTEFTVNAQPFQMPNPRGPPFPVPSVPTSRSVSRGRRDDDEDGEDERKRRQRSMDAAARDVSTSIPWLTAPQRREVKERTPQRAIPSNVPVSPLNPQRPTSKIPVASGSRKRNSKGSFRESPKKQLVPLQVTRIKTIGNVKQRTTPRPVQDHPGMTRGSVYIQPIMIPRQSATLGGVFAVNEEGEPETLVTESPVDMRGVRRDSDVFGTTLGGEMRR